VIESAVSKQRFFFGSRPSRAEIGLFGILSQEIQDLTTSEFMRTDYNRIRRWLGLIDDMSGCEGEWQPLSTDADKLIASPVAEILKLSAKYHLPLLQANDEALAKGEKSLSFDIDGTPFNRIAHKRHAECLSALQQHYAALSQESKNALQQVLAETGCLPYFATA